MVNLRLARGVSRSYPGELGTCLISFSYSTHATPVEELVPEVAHGVDLAPPQKVTTPSERYRCCGTSGIQERADKIFAEEGVDPARSQV